MRHLLLAAAILVPGVALASTPATTGNGPKLDALAHTSGKQTQSYWSPPAGRIVVANTLGKRPYQYNKDYGDQISSPASPAKSLQWVAAAITPKKTVTLTEILEGFTHVAGTGAVTMALLADKNGAPGAVLTQKNVNVKQVAGECCAVAIDHVTNGPQLIAGKTYWVAAILPNANEAKTWDAWNLDSGLTVGNGAVTRDGKKWIVSQGTSNAFAVFGQ